MARLDERSYDMRHQMECTDETVFTFARIPHQKTLYQLHKGPRAVHRQEPVEMAPQPMSNADNRPNEDVVVRRSVRASNPPKYLAEYVLTNK